MLGGHGSVLVGVLLRSRHVLLFRATARAPMTGDEKRI